MNTLRTFGRAKQNSCIRIPSKFPLDATKKFEQFVTSTEQFVCPHLNKIRSTILSFQCASVRNNDASSCLNIFRFYFPSSAFACVRNRSHTPTHAHTDATTTGGTCKSWKFKGQKIQAHGKGIATAVLRRNSRSPTDRQCEANCLKQCN